MKQLQPHPWENVEGRYPKDERVQGKVVSITDYGAFVELEEGVEGLVHISEMSWTQHIRHPSKVLSIGDEITVVILKVDKDDQKISLGLKQVTPDPWLSLDDKYPTGTRLMGTVRNLTNFGAFVEIEEGIDGLVHISDMSWTKRIRHPNEVVKKAQEIEVVVLGIDKDRRRISLGHKQTIENPWPELAVKFSVGTQSTGEVSRVLERGVVIDLEGDVEGFIPASQLGVPNLKLPEEHFGEGEDVPAKVVEFDEDQKKIVLSVQEYLRDVEQEEIDAYLEAHQQREVVVTESTEEEMDDPYDDMEDPGVVAQDDESEAAEVEAVAVEAAGGDEEVEA
jgi:small subunit ribosomal protein S1